MKKIGLTLTAIIASVAISNSYSKSHDVTVHGKAKIELAILSCTSHPLPVVLATIPGEDSTGTSRCRDLYHFLTFRL